MATDHAAGVLGEKSLGRVVLVLGMTQITSWGVLYYAFPVLGPSISLATGWSSTGVSAAFSASLLTAAVVGIVVGLGIDRFGPRPIMTLGSGIGAVAVVLVARASSYPAFVGAWILAGVATSALLYPPAFATLTQWAGPHRVRALTALTLIAGFSSTVFAPLTAALEEWLGWRQTYMVLAGVLVTVTVPGHWLGLRHRWVRADHRPDTSTGHRAAVWRTRPFLMLLIAMTTTALCVYATVINLVPLLLERGLPLGLAALALGLGGIGQVAGRVGYGWFSRRTSVRVRSGVVAAMVAGTTALLALLPATVGLLVALSVLAGGARGMFTLIQATAVSDRWGTARFGQVNALVLAPVTVATAAAPWVGSVLAEGLGSYARAFVVLAGAAVLAGALTPWTVPRSRAVP